MAAVKVKQKMSKDIKADIQQLSGIFKQLTESGEADYQIIAPKYEDAVQTMRSYAGVLRLYLEIDSIKAVRYEHPSFDAAFADIETFAAQLEKALPVGDTSMDAAFWGATMAGDEAKVRRITDEVNKKYAALKESDVVKIMTNCCAALKDYEPNLAAVYTPPADKISQFSRFHSTFERVIEKSDDWNFVDEMNVVSKFEPLYFAPNLDFRYLWIVMDDKKSQRYNVNFLSHIYFKGCQLFDIVTSPDVDIDQLSELFVQSICKFKNMFKGCKDAFNVLEKSVDILKKNFAQYYRDSVAKDQGLVFIENFMFDVAVKSGADDANMKVQFKKLASEINKMVGGNKELSQNPQIKMLCELMNSQLN